jgi:mono/diheme cytochrome c family protein
MAALAALALVEIRATPRARAEETKAPQAAAGQAVHGSVSAESIEFFEKQIRPLLVQNCLACHGEKRKGGLQLDSAGAMLKGGDSGPAITAGDPDDSLLIRAVRYDDEPKMPPDAKLSGEAIAALTEWVKMGAPWPATSGSTPIADAAKSHWAFQPVKKPPLPETSQSAWPREPVDHFVLAKLEEQHLAPSPAADRRTLIRRASFDVVGLPPTAKEVEQFVNDPDPAAFGHVVERLLASPSYGERWARHWLDVARYADTKGYVFTADRKYPNAYRYRDWVVRALNDDLPYNEFLIRQIAADRLPAPDKDSLAAMGFLTVGRRFLNNSHDIIDDRLDVLARGTMALTLTCARCHDHKYDPIPTRDYYSLYGVLASSVEPDQPADLMTLADASQPVEPHVFVRGNSGNQGEAVARQFLSVIAGENRQPFSSGSGRLELARAIASGDNPLTARVIVNRVWLCYFNQGLVRTPSDFGLRSQPPSHPQLLDYLASQLVEQNWSLKDLHRQILNSAAYQQASNDRPECRQVDPENRLLWRMNRKRLDFEALRDSLLAVSGQLDRSLGGPAVELTAVPWATRRTIYGLIDRQNLPSLFRTFDFASPDTHSPQRFTTTVPQQSLYMLNSPFVRDQARSLAARGELASASAPGERIERLYRLALSRVPSERELSWGLAFLADEESRPPEPNAIAADGAAKPVEDAKPNDSARAFSPWERYVQIVLASNEFVYVD